MLYQQTSVGLGYGWLYFSRRLPLLRSAVVPAKLDVCRPPRPKGAPSLGRRRRLGQGSGVSVELFPEPFSHEVYL